MSELSKYLVEQILLEDINPIKKNIVVYVGRFQPMHKGHFAVYQHLVKKFGKDNVFIGTSNKVQLPKSPFNFKEKELIATKMYGIPKSKFIQVKNPYNPSEVLSKFNPETTSFTTVVSEKDSNRLGGKYFTPYTDEPSQGYKDKGYVYIVPILGKGVSGTEVREKLSSGTEKEKKEFFKNRVFGKFNKPIYDLITSKLNEGIFISKERIEEWMINEASSIVGDGGDVDDGPSFFVPNYDVFSKVSVDRAKKIGYEVINMIMSKDIEDYYEHPRYPNGPVRAVTPFPAGVLGATTANNQVDIYSSDAYSKWFKHATRKASLVGYSLVSDPNIKSDKKQSGDDAKGDLKAQSEYENSINEAITLPVEIGDTLLMGKFKNKKVVVKSIGKDEHGMPTINGKKVVTFRYVNESFIVELAGTSVQCEKCNHSWEIESDDDEKYLCHSCGWDSQQQEYDYDAFDSWREKMGLNEDSNPNSHPQGSKKLSSSTTVMDMLDIISHKEFGPDYQKLSNLQKKKVHKIALKHKILESYLEELDERGKLRPSEKLRRKAAMAGKGREIARKRARTMKRRKSLDKLKKIAYKKAYKQVYDEFAKELFPDTPKSQLSIQQSKVVHRNVLRKKKRVLKRAKFKFLPDLRAKEVEKFSPKNKHLTNEKNSGKTNEMSKSTLNKIEKFAEKKLSPEDIEFTKHFFDRINDPRNGKEISDAELTGFFKRLSKYKKQFKEFLEKYKQIVVTDKRHSINIPFVKQTNQIIAKTIMRKDDFKTSNPVLSFEQYINEGGAATGGSPIPAEHTMGMYNDVVKVLSSTFKITKKDARPLGSTGKKKAGDFSGDIDIAVDAAKIGSNFKLKFNEVQDFIYNKLKSKFKNVVNMKGLGIISFLYPIPNSDKFGQTDIMLSDNLELTSFMFHSPNFIENESKYKGLYRNDLLFSIVKYLPTNIPDEYFEDGKDKGEIKKFTKHTLSQKKGLITQLKSFEGKLGKTKNAKPIKGADVQITNVPNDIVKYIFGKKYNVDDVKSFEAVYKIIMKSDFKHKKILPKVIKNFKDSILRKKLPLPSEIK